MQLLYFCLYSDTIDSVKQSAALCLLHLLRNSPDAVPMSEWSSRIIHLLNDQHMVSSITGLKWIAMIKQFLLVHDMICDWHSLTNLAHVNDHFTLPRNCS